MVQRSKRKFKAEALIKKSQRLTKYLEVKKEPRLDLYCRAGFYPVYKKRINYNYIKKRYRFQITQISRNLFQRIKIFARI